MKIIAIAALCCLIFFSGAAQSYEQLIEKSYDYLDKNDLPAAEESLKAAMRLAPANAINYALLTNLGTIQRRQGKVDSALLSYTAALGQQPNDVTALLNRASLYAEMGNVHQAIVDYSALIAEDPVHQEGLYNRGLLYLQQKDFIRAQADFEAILHTNRQSVRGRLGFAVMEKTRGNYDESERIYNYLINEMPQEWVLYEGRAELYFLMGKNSRALGDINKLFLHSKPNAWLYLLRGKVKLAQYERKAAIRDFHTAEQLGYDKAVVRQLIEMAR